MGSVVRWWSGWSCGVLLLLGLQAAVAAPSGPLQAYAQEIVTLVVRGDYDLAASRFHYPEDYTPETLAADRYQVAQNLSDMVAAFGAMSEVTSFDGNALIRELGTSGGDHRYWARYPGGYSLRFRVRFENEGVGYVKVRLAEIDGALKVRAVSFGLPAGNADVGARIGRLKRQLLAARAQRRQTGLGPI